MTAGGLPVSSRGLLPSAVIRDVPWLTIVMPHPTQRAVGPGTNAGERLAPGPALPPEVKR